MPVDPAAVQHSVEALLAGIDRSNSGTTQPVADGLARVVHAAAAILPADSVGLLLLDEHDRLRAVVASAPAAEALERAQTETGVGPGIDTVSMACTVTVDDLGRVDRYAELTRTSAAQAARAVVSAPVWVNGSVAGNLNALRSEPHEWTITEIDAVEKYADVVATLLQVNASRLRTGRPGQPRQDRPGDGQTGDGQPGDGPPRESTVDS